MHGASEDNSTEKNPLEHCSHLESFSAVPVDTKGS